MIDQKNINNLPFEADGGNGLYGHKPRAMHVMPPRYMSTRASLFLAFVTVGLNISLMTEMPVWLPFLATLSMVLLWSFTLRFIKGKWSAPVVVAVLSLLVFGVSYYMNEMTLMPGLLMVMLGIASLNAMNLDDSGEYVLPGIVKEVLLPLIYSCAAALTGSFVSRLFEHRFLFVSNIISVTFLILISIAISKSTGSRYFFTSRSLTEFWDIPVAEFSQTKIFIIAKIKFIITILFCFGACIAVSLLLDGKLLKFLITPAAIIAVIPFIYICPMVIKDSSSQFGTRYFMYEAFIAAQLISMFFLMSGSLSVEKTVYAFVVIVGSDIIGSALLAVIRRRQIFVSRSKYIDGTPFMMTMFSLLIMLLECCLFSVI